MPLRPDPIVFVFEQLGQMKSPSNQFCGLSVMRVNPSADAVSTIRRIKCKIAERVLKDCLMVRDGPLFERPQPFRPLARIYAAINPSLLRCSEITLLKRSL